MTGKNIAKKAKKKDANFPICILSELLCKKKIWDFKNKKSMGTSQHPRNNRWVNKSQWHIFGGNHKRLVEKLPFHSSLMFTFPRIQYMKYDVNYRIIGTTPLFFRIPYLHLIQYLVLCS